MSYSCPPSKVKMKLVKTCANHKHFLCLGCNIEFKYDFTFSKLIEANINET